MKASPHLRNNIWCHNAMKALTFYNSVQKGIQIRRQIARRDKCSIRKCDDNNTLQMSENE